MRTDFLTQIAGLVPSLQAHAPALDKDPCFPAEDIAALRAAGLLRAPLPVAYGGAGLGEGVAGAAALFETLALLGEGNLPVARLYEAHVNALQLVFRYGHPTLRARVAAEVGSNAGAGHLFGLWVTDPPVGGLHLHAGGMLSGTKLVCSGAGGVTRALVSAETPGGVQMLIVDVSRAVCEPARLRLAGMRAAVTGAMKFDGMVVEPWQHLGQPGDYLGEPVFSAGAWRAAAAALGGLTALVKLHRDELIARGRTANPAQTARFGEALIAVETARLWMAQAAQRACLEDRPAAEIVAYVNLARLAVEAACLDALRLAQRSLGLACFAIGHPVERVARDLAVFLRQPAPDEVLATAAQYYFAQPGLPA
jgi:alkylation response protein AidB-like acyl-CoA dehydrogenase